MPVAFSVLVYDPVQETYSVPVIFYPVVSSPGDPSYTQRGIFTTEMLNVLGENNSIYSDQRTILDIRTAEFPIKPLQGDHIAIPSDCNGENQGEWVIIDSSDNGGGQTTFTLRKVEARSKSGVP